jgi:hypothetical protein
MQVYFPGVVLSMDTSTDCHLSYKPLGKLAQLSSLHYDQPHCPPTIYPTEGSAFWAKTASSQSPSNLSLVTPAVIEDDGSLAPVEVVVTDGSLAHDDTKPVPNLTPFTSVVPEWGPCPTVHPFSADGIVTISKHLKLLLDCLSGITESPSPDSSPPASDAVAPLLLSSLSPDEVVRLVHCPGSLPPPIHPCDRSNRSDTKTYWTSEELHCALGCCRFQNYKHILQTSLDGKWVDGGEFPLALSTYTTIPKAPRGGAINREHSFFLDIVHVDIAFCDCILVGGFQYSLIFVNRATCYNWVFGLKDLSHDLILLAFRLFRADASSYAWCF